MRSLLAAVCLLLAEAASAQCPGWSVPSSAKLIAGLELIVADVDGDGRRDVLTYRDDIRVAFGGDTGISRGRTIIDDGPYTAVAVADLDRDGRPDIITAAASIQVLHNGGSTLFSGRTLTAITANRLTTADLDGDPFPDLIILGGQGNEIITFLGDGQGFFFAPMPSDFGGSPVELVTGDFNGDRRTDVAVVDPDRPGVVVSYAGDGKGKIQPLGSADFGKPVKKLIAFDADADGRTDLAAITDRVQLVRSTGSGFASLPDLPTPANPAQVVAADFDHDGGTDLAVLSPDLVTIWLNDGRGAFRRAPDVPMTGLRLIAAGDFSGDAVPDLLLQTDFLLTSLPSARNGTFRRSQPLPPSFAFHTVAGDLDADGDTDVVTNDLTIWRNTSGTLVPQPFHSTGDGSSQIGLADLDGDGRPEIIAAGEISGNLSALSIYRTNAPVPIRTFHTEIAGDIIGFAAGDFDGDGRDEVLMYTESGVGSLIVANPEPRIVIQVALPPLTFPALAVDFDGDRRDDVVLLRDGTEVPGGYLDDGFVAVMRSLGGGTFAAPQTIVTNLAPYIAHAGDFDGDRKPDFAIVADDAVRIAYSNGFVFEVRALPERPPYGRLFTAEAVADVDGDGHDDIAGLYESGESAPQDAVVFLGGRGEIRGVSFGEDIRPFQIFEAIALAQVDGVGGLELIEFGDVQSLIHPALCGPGRRRPR
ncbi:MAG TPA: VCBS repeat-containing protein [Thermoanaerobaculia bacterium]|nr:VCBS repeat-containing protein [Thermoanaerobaculia bacterium]